MASLSEVYGSEVKALDITKDFKVCALDEVPTSPDEYTMYLVSQGSDSNQFPYTDLYYGGRKLTDLVVLSEIPSTNTYPENKLYLVIDDEKFIYNLYVVHNGEAVPVPGCQFLDGFVEEMSLSDDGSVVIAWRVLGEKDPRMTSLVTTDYNFVSSLKDGSVSFSKMQFTEGESKILHGDGQWKEVVSQLSGLGDVKISSPSEGDILIYKNGRWVNSLVDLGDHIVVDDGDLDS